LPHQPPVTRREAAGPGGPATRPGLASLLLGSSVLLRPNHCPKRVMTLVTKPRRALWLELGFVPGNFA